MSIDYLTPFQVHVFNEPVSATPLDDSKGEPTYRYCFDLLRDDPSSYIAIHSLNVFRMEISEAKNNRVSKYIQVKEYNEVAEKPIVGKGARWVLVSLRIDGVIREKWVNRRSFSKRMGLDLLDTSPSMLVEHIANRMAKHRAKSIHEEFPSLPLEHIEALFHILIPQMQMRKKDEKELVERAARVILNDMISGPQGFLEKIVRSVDEKAEDQLERKVVKVSEAFTTFVKVYLDYLIGSNFRESPYLKSFFSCEGNITPIVCEEGIDAWKIHLRSIPGILRARKIDQRLGDIKHYLSMAWMTLRILHRDVLSIPYVFGIEPYIALFKHYHEELYLPGFLLAAARLYQEEVASLQLDDHARRCCIISGQYANPQNLPVIVRAVDFYVKYFTRLQIDAERSDQVFLALILIFEKEPRLSVEILKSFFKSYFIPLCGVGFKDLELGAQFIRLLFELSRSSKIASPDRALQIAQRVIEHCNQSGVKHERAWSALIEHISKNEHLKATAQFLGATAQRPASIEYLSNGHIWIHVEEMGRDAVFSPQLKSSIWKAFSRSVIKVYEYTQRRLGYAIQFSYDNEGERSKVQKEASIFKLLENERGIMQLLETPYSYHFQRAGTVKSQTTLIVADYTSNLDELLQGDQEALASAHRARIASDIIAGVEAMHKKGVVHGNLKPENVFLDERGDACIGNFELAQTISKEGLDAKQTEQAFFYDIRDLLKVLKELLTDVKISEANTIDQVKAMLEASFKH